MPCSKEDDQEKPRATSPFPGLLFWCLAQHCNVVSPKRKLRGCSTVLELPRGNTAHAAPTAIPPLWPLPKSRARSCLVAFQKTPVPSGNMTQVSTCQNTTTGPGTGDFAPTH